MSTLAVILAAGAGSRFSGPTHKLNAPFGSSTIAATSIANALASNIGAVLVISGAVALERLPPEAEIIENRKWTEGQATSLSIAVQTAMSRSATAIVVGLADQPLISPTSWRAVAGSRSPIAVATYDGQQRNPVRLAAQTWHMLPTTGDRGAREVIRLSPTLVERVPCTGSPADIDTLEDLQKWQNG